MSARRTPCPWPGVRLLSKEIPPPASGLRRIIRAAGFSWAGLCYTFQNEAAFRQEILLSLVVVPGISILPFTLLAKLYLVACLALVLICELANTALEVVINHISPDYSETAKHGKNIGSALVFVSLVNFFISFAFLFYSII